MNQEEQNNVSLDTITNNQEIVEQSLCDETEEVRKYYLHQSRLMYLNMSKDKSDNARLIALKKRTELLIEMLTLFDRSWAEEISLVQKVCLSHLSTGILPRKERAKVIDALNGWSDLLFRLARHRELLLQFLQYHHRMGQELRSLLTPVDTGASPEPQETTEKGGE